MRRMVEFNCTSNCLLMTTDVLSVCGLEQTQQSAVDDVIDQWRRRLLACVDAEGGHFEHNLGLQTSRENFTSVF